MKLYIKSARNNIVIFEGEYFEFVRTSGIGIKDTHYEGLAVRTKRGSLAEKHVVEVRLNYKHSPAFDGGHVRYTYRDAYVAYGLGSAKDSLDDTREFIEVLENAVDFAEKVNEYLYRHPGEEAYDDLDYEAE